MSYRTGPAKLFAAWLIHDVEEAITFPATCDRLADQTGIERLRMDQRQSWVAVGLMGAIVALACHAGAKTEGRSKSYRAVVAGLEGHVATHLVASAIQRRYTAGVLTAVPVMLPGAAAARRELRDAGSLLTPRDYLRGAAILLPAALACQALARLLLKRRSCLR
jgi:hypothetical protein